MNYVMRKKHPLFYWKLFYGSNNVHIKKKEKESWRSANGDDKKKKKGGSPLTDPTE
jgi:hypothetical protein